MSGKFDAAMLFLLGRLKSDVTDYCDLETVDGGKSIVAKDGSLVSIIRFNGVKNILSREGYDEMIETLNNTFKPFFHQKGYQIQVLFRKDIDSRAMLNKIGNIQRDVAKKLHLDVGDLIEESIERYAKYIYQEECYLALWSRPALMSAQEHNIEKDTRNAYRKESNIPAMPDAQNLLRPLHGLYDRHTSYVNKIVTDMSSHSMACSVELLDVSDAVREIKRSVYPDYVDELWTPSIPEAGKHSIPFRWKQNSKKRDESALLYPTLPEQIMVASAASGKKGMPLADPTMVRVGSRTYAPLTIAIPPRDNKVFNDLFSSLNNAETTERGEKRSIPYAISFMLESDGMGGTAFNHIMSQVLSFSSDQNKNINNAMSALKERVRDGECIVKLRITAMTWSGNEADEVKELALRKMNLWRSLQSWGNMTVIERTGDPFLAFQANTLGMSYKNIGAPCPAPLTDALSLLPLTRPCSPFTGGTVMFRSRDGKLMPYQRFSSEQTTWITLISGKPGSGKSVLMNNNNFESCLMPGLTRLPYISIMDVGVSSLGFIDLVRDNLPKDKQHLVLYKRLQNTKHDCINPMDTSLGQRTPLQRDREFIKNFISILITAPERKGQVMEGMSNFVGRVIDLAYRQRSDKVERATPAKYKAGYNKVIDDAIIKTGAHIRPATTYWELVDLFFDNGLLYEAELAQRYAVPTLDDLAEVVSSEDITSEYADILTEGNRPIINTFRIGVREAVSDYPMFSSETQFDIGSARVMAIDLQDVAIKGSDSAVKQTALMYMISRQSFLKKVGYSDEDLPSISPKYQAYFEQLIKQISEEPKVMCMDEFHFTEGQPVLINQLNTDGRVSRKWNMEIVLASQRIEDFGDMIKTATSIFLLDNGTADTRKWMKENIGLTDTEEAFLRQFVHGANAQGSTFLARFQTKDSNYSQLFTLTAGSMRLWALSTTAEDRKLRGLLYERLDKSVARQLLAKRFPSGSCKREVDKMKMNIGKFSGDGFTFEDPDAVEASIVEKIAQEILNAHFANPTLQEVV